MACVLTTGFTLDCKDSNGGIEAVYFTELANKTAITAASGVITAITLAGSKKFFKYELRKQVGLYEENITVNNENGTVFYEQVLTLALSKKDVAKRNEILLLAQNEVLVIIKDNNGKYWLAGETRGCYISAGKSSTGTAFGDRSGFELTITGQELAMAQEVDSSIIAALTA